MRLVELELHDQLEDCSQVCLCSDRVCTLRERGYSPEHKELSLIRAQKVQGLRGGSSKSIGFYITGHIEDKKTPGHLQTRSG